MSSSKINKNIANAIDVILNTYENINKFLTELDYQSTKCGFVPITPRFLRWRSDNEFKGFYISSFIKLFQKEDEPVLSTCEELKNAPVYGIEVDLNDLNGIDLILAKYEYNFDIFEWHSTPVVSEHWGFCDPLHNKTSFRHKVNGDKNKSTPQNDKIKDKYWGLEQVIYKTIDIFEIDSIEKIKESLFKQLALL